MHLIKHGENNLIMSFCIEHQDITKLHKWVEHLTIFSKKKTEIFVFAKNLVFLFIRVYVDPCSPIYSVMFHWRRSSQKITHAIGALAFPNKAVSMSSRTGAEPGFRHRGGQTMVKQENIFFPRELSNSYISKYILHLICLDRLLFSWIVSSYSFFAGCLAIVNIVNSSTYAPSRPSDNQTTLKHDMKCLATKHCHMERTIIV